MTAEEFLSRPAELNRRIRSDTESLDALRAVAESCTQRLNAAGIRHDTASGRGCFEDVILDITKQENELKEKIAAFASAERDAVAMIRLLPDDMERNVLLMRYIGCMPYAEIEKQLNTSEGNIYRIRREALAHLTEIGHFEKRCVKKAARKTG